MRYLLLLGIALGCLTGAVRAEVIAPGNNVAGLSQATLGDNWWKWIIETPNPINPLNDSTGANAHVNNNGPVFFVAGSTGGGFAHRAFTVRAGVPLFFPMVNTVDVELPVSLDPNTCLAKPDPYACALASISSSVLPTDVVATLNDQPLDPSLPGDVASYFHQSSALVPVCLPTDSIFGPVPATCGAAFVQKGFYMAIEGLAPGTYTLEFGSGGEATGFGAIDTITVVAPEPASLALLGIGLAATTLMRRQRRQTEKVA